MVSAPVLCHDRVPPAVREGLGFAVHIHGHRTVRLTRG